MADRLRRIWDIVEEIAAHPGHSRAELAELFGYGERQVQDDLNIIRREMGLPLVRRQGYRFMDDGSIGSGLTAREAQLAVFALDRADRAGLMPRGEAGPLLDKLVGAFPPHLRPLVARTVRALRRPDSRERVFTALADAILTGQTVRLRWTGDSRQGALERPSPVGRPLALLPWLDRWFVVGVWRVDGDERARVYAVDDVAAVAAVLGDDAGRRAS